MKIISIIVGLTLLCAAIVLSYVSATNGKQILVNQEKIVMKYVNKSDALLEDEDIAGAIKYAKLAIQANPKSKKGYTCYTNAMEEKYQTDGTETEYETSPSQNSESESALGC